MKLDCTFERHNQAQNEEQASTRSTHIFKGQRKENSLKITEQNGNKITLSKWKLSAGI